jgi:hypothetical protein
MIESGMGKEDGEKPPPGKRANIQSKKQHGSGNCCNVNSSRRTGR